MQKPTTREIIVRMLGTPVLFALFVLLPAGTVNYWEAWVSLFVFMIAAIMLTIWLVKNDPALLERRMNVGPQAETRSAQQFIVGALLFCFAGSYIVSALDHRFGWSHVPAWIVLFGDLLQILCWWIFFVVMRANSFAAATIRVESDQKVISTGPYGIVRHPMYSGALLLMIAVPLSLGSYWGIMLALIGLPVLHWRIVDEEAMLVKDLPGYDEYRRNVRFRIFPGVY